ncbi:MAG: galactose-1-phosphate uridylyltransferase [Caldithrix sp.]|nr:MAG: galactose-1-phosphate uridylyltransferase [Caldithrix sp.]
MAMNQFRRDPITGRWSIIFQEEYKVEDLISNTTPRRKKKSNGKCQLCGGFEAETPSEIFAIRDDKSNKNESGWKVRVVPDKQPFLQIYGDLDNRGMGMYDVLNGIGAHELVIESPKHNEQIYDMDLDQIQNVLFAYRERFVDLKRDTRFRYVLLHKNYGDGNDQLKNHSHSHIIATPITPARVKYELMNTREHYQYKERCLFCDIINQELEDDERIILQNDKFVALTPFASRAPFEISILPKQHETFFEWNNEYSQLAFILKEVLRKLSSTLNDPNFVMVLHSGPNVAAGKQRGYWKTIERDYHWHIDITPQFRGFTSFEIGSGFQINVISPETAARILREEKYN